MVFNFWVLHNFLIAALYHFVQHRQEIFTRLVQRTSVINHSDVKYAELGRWHRE